jgi:hypothetical protein
LGWQGPQAMRHRAARNIKPHICPNILRASRRLPNENPCGISRLSKSQAGEGLLISIGRGGPIAQKMA